MTIKELIQVVEDAHELLVADFKSETKKTPKDDDLLLHVKTLYKQGLESTILEELFLDDFDCPEDFEKLVLIFAAKLKSS